MKSVLRCSELTCSTAQQGAKKSVLNNSRTANRKQSEQQGKSCDVRRPVYLLFFLSALGVCSVIETSQTLVTAQTDMLFALRSEALLMRGDLIGNARQRKHKKATLWLFCARRAPASCGAVAPATRSVAQTEEKSKSKSSPSDSCFFPLFALCVSRCSPNGTPQVSFIFSAGLLLRGSLLGLTRGGRYRLRLSAQALFPAFRPPLVTLSVSKCIRTERNSARASQVLRTLALLLSF